MVVQRPGTQKNQVRLHKFVAIGFFRRRNIWWPQMWPLPEEAPDLDAQGMCCICCILLHFLEHPLLGALPTCFPQWLTAVACTEQKVNRRCGRVTEAQAGTCQVSKIYTRRWAQGSHHWHLETSEWAMSDCSLCFSTGRSSCSSQRSATSLCGRWHSVFA